MTFETIGSGEENFANSFDKLLQEVEKKENPKKPLELLLDEAIKRNNKEKDAKFVKQLTPEQRNIVILKAQELFQKIWGSNESWKATDELQITTDEKGLYIRIRRNTDQEWQGPRFIDFSEIPKPYKPNTREEEAAYLLKETQESLKTYLSKEINEAFERNKGETPTKNRLFPLANELSSSEKAQLEQKLGNLWLKYSSWGKFDPDKYEIRITMDPKTKTIYGRIVAPSNREYVRDFVVGGGAVKIERKK